ncbi:DUF6894 family protein [Methylobacterium sp. PvR107]|uniref:DUF6894 family protein n=1 Tax=Methylobacterium sp. PvR107 TaxID=2806597 RepID=UPI001AE75742|nr:hypothetical protein [Methylobacterium sp. PvR107]MBP1182105.1 hypothetical protein [Methylobacterium sp. PvR107]
MPLFYFHLRGPNGLERDDVGLELPCVDAAYLGACRAVPGMSADLAREETNPARYAFEITDACGNLLMDVPFTEVLDRGHKPAAPGSGARRGKAAVEMARTASLIFSIREEHAALQVTLTETRRLLALSRKLGRTPL